MSGSPEIRRHALSRTLLAGLAYFGMVFAVGFLLGSVRIFLLLPWLGEAAAVLVELPVILCIAWFACRLLVRAFDVPPRITMRLTMGGIAFLTLIGAELGLSLFAFGRTPGEHLAQYREVHALLGLAGQVAFALFPFVHRIGDQKSKNGDELRLRRGWRDQR